jgi:hypothetical protein
MAFHFLKGADEPRILLFQCEDRKRALIDDLIAIRRRMVHASKKSYHKVTGCTCRRTLASENTNAKGLTRQ